MKRILIIAGPSAVGKTTVMKELMRISDSFEYIRSATTREIRGDIFDSEYIYVTKEEFLSRVNSKDMLEYTEYGGNYYGTPASEIERIFKKGKTPLLILDINGVKSLKNAGCAFEVFSVYLTADLETLDRRLYERALAKGKSEDALITYEKRKKTNRNDYENFKNVSKYFDLVTENVNVEDTASKILKAFKN